MKCEDRFICELTNSPNVDLSYPMRCPLGTYWTKELNSTSSQYEYNCIDCPPGHKCTFDSVKEMCPDGTFQSYPGQMDCEECDPGLGERCENGAARKADYIVAKCKSGVFEEISAFLSVENTGRIG